MRIANTRENRFGKIPKCRFTIRTSTIREWAFQIVAEDVVVLLVLNPSAGPARNAGPVMVAMIVDTKRRAVFGKAI